MVPELSDNPLNLGYTLLFVNSLSSLNNQMQEEGLQGVISRNKLGLLWGGYESQVFITTLLELHLI